jgi:hypothetical protein
MANIRIVIDIEDVDQVDGSALHDLFFDFIQTIPPEVIASIGGGWTIEIQDIATYERVPFDDLDDEPTSPPSEDTIKEDARKLKESDGDD